jgi:membrane protease subunit (stomatin/prohibitin family)
MAYSADIEEAALASGNAQLAAYGIELTRMGNFDINLKPEDEQQLKQLAKDTSYSKLAGGFQQYAAGEMALGAGQGMAQGGAATEGAFLGAGFGLASAMGAQQAAAMQQQQQAYQQVPPPAPAPTQPAPAPAAGPACAGCQTPNPAGAKFCVNCGQQLAPQVRHCAECGGELTAGAKFCATCGTRVEG